MFRVYATMDQRLPLSLVHPLGAVDRAERIVLRWWLEAVAQAGVEGDARAAPQRRGQRGELSALVEGRKDLDADHLVTERGPRGYVVREENERQERAGNVQNGKRVVAILAIPIRAQELAVGTHHRSRATSLVQRSNLALLALNAS